MFRGLFAYYLNFCSLNFLAAIFSSDLHSPYFLSSRLARPLLQHYIHKHLSVVVVVKCFWIEPFLRTNNTERRYSSLHWKPRFRLDLQRLNLKKKMFSKQLNRVCALTYILCACTTLTKPMQIITAVTDVTVLERFHEKKSHFTA